MKKTAKTSTSAGLIPLFVADVYQLAGAFRRWGEGIAAEVGQTQVRWQLLSAASVGGRTVAQLARRLGLARQSVQRTADQLVQDGLAEYRENIDHRRSPHLQLTPAGQQTLEDLIQAARRHHLALAQEMREEDLQIARNVVRDLWDSLEEKLPQPE